MFNVNEKIEKGDWYIKKQTDRPHYLVGCKHFFGVAIFGEEIYDLQKAIEDFKKDDKAKINGFQITSLSKDSAVLHYSWYEQHSEIIFLKSTLKDLQNIISKVIKKDKVKP